MSERIQVVAAVISDREGRLLIAKRPQHKHQGGLWEFPGGKQEQGEAAETALKRELQEELGISIRDFEPFIQVSHDYRDKEVFLDIWRVTGFSGEAHGREDQEVRWVTLDEINEYRFPAANQAIIERLLSE